MCVDLKARTNVSKILRGRQASATMTAHPHINKSNNFIHIGDEKVRVIFEPTMPETICVINVLH